MGRAIVTKWRRYAIRDLANIINRADLLKEGRCVSRSGLPRKEHYADKDGVCVFCDVDLWELEEGEGEEDETVEDGQAR